MNDKFIVKAKQKFGDKFSYDKVRYINNKTKVTITCPIHGDFDIRPGNFLNISKYGCNKCGNSSKSQHNLLTEEDYFDRCSKIHSHKFDYTDAVYTKTHDDITILCPTHGKFTTKAYVHLQGHDCPECAKEANSISTRLSKDQDYPVELYYIYLPELNLWKIGCTKNLQERFKYLPYDYEVIFTEIFTKSTQAYFIEGWLLKATCNNKVKNMNHIKGYTELRSNGITNILELINEAKEAYNGKEELLSIQ